MAAYELNVVIIAASGRVEGSFAECGTGGDTECMGPEHQDSSSDVTASNVFVLGLAIIEVSKSPEQASESPSTRHLNMH